MSNLIQYNYEEFVQDWGETFKKVPLILEYLDSLKRLNKKLNEINFLHPEELLQSQKDWLWLLCKLDHPLERDFFKPYWVPLESDSFDYFIDLSSPGFEMFDTNYFGSDFSSWFKSPLFENVSKLMSSNDVSSEFIQSCFEKNTTVRHKKIDQFAKKRMDAGIKGLIKPEKVKNSELVSDNRPIIAELTEGRIVLRGVSSLIASILKLDTEINLQYFDMVRSFEEPINPRIRSISVLIFLLRTQGYGSILGYTFSFCEGGREMHCQFSEETVEFGNLTEEFKSKLIKRIKRALQLSN